MLNKYIIKTTVFTDVQPNPTISNVDAGLAKLKEAKCDCVISLVGGSPQDCAKGIALEFPLIAINTTAGTACDNG